MSLNTNVEIFVHSVFVLLNTSTQGQSKNGFVWKEVS